ncbi:hypothetical protein CIG75_00580 [Tumebacillus algifaecis]|uniref:Uncharacterized protein n=1 Tax=Tumebacillus algifaecis TaxID=1214604 RepID=A0A223CWB2_9BACL|nr:hypothetical protein [Tumebacillus algifaecis]ASS73618.1 hypothetical protein CIG75_00580 [Tumebacillus algifaecis]
MELDRDAKFLGSTKRSSFINYLNAGANGWYMGGWVWDAQKVNRYHTIHDLVDLNDRLYDNIYQFVKGTYQSGTALLNSR